jgi:hypothetical protein
MVEVAGRFVDAEAARAPAANAYKLIYTVPALSSGPLGIDVCNGEATDAHVDIWIVPAAEAYADGAEPPAYSIVHKKQRVQADGTDGSFWPSPVKHVNAGDCIVVRTDVVGVTFYPHGIAGA